MEKKKNGARLRESSALLRLADAYQNRTFFPHKPAQEASCCLRLAIFRNWKSRCSGSQNRQRFLFAPLLGASGAAFLNYLVIASNDLWLRKRSLQRQTYVEGGRKEREEGLRISVFVSM